MSRLSELRVLLFAFAAACFLCGCSAEELERLLGLDKPKEAVFMLSFHREVAYPRGNLQGEMPLRMPNGVTRVLERYPMMSSHFIIDAAAKPVPGKEGFYRIFLKPDLKGRMMWMQLTALSRNEPVAIMLDGLYFGELRPREVSTGEETWVELPLDVDAARAQQIVKYANDNYRFFNNNKREDAHKLFPEDNF
ncbi:MAG: hypothetical protein IKD10_10260 [Lentisphaeria bacterium]|nr:hypothetical protein [Lentisphaeria bacterium]